MLYGEISAYILFHGEISSFTLHSCITELALGPEGPQSSLNHRICYWTCSWKHLESSGNPLESSGKLWNSSRCTLRRRASHVSRGLLPAISHGLPGSPVVSRGIPWSPVIYRGIQLSTNNYNRNPKKNNYRKNKKTSNLSNI